MRILVTGGNGMLAEGIRREFQGEQLILTDLFTIDVRNEKMVLDAEEIYGKFDAILHLAAETDLEVCQINPANAYFVNTIGTINLMRLARRMDIPIVYMSTAGIFDGTNNRPYIETDKPNPINFYGLSKYYGELGIHNYEKHYIFRMSWAMGGGEKLDKKFINKIHYLIKMGKDTLYVVNDKFGSPTYTRDVAKAILHALRVKIPFGTYHLSGKGVCSRYDVAKEMVNILGLKVGVVPVQSSYYGDYFCPRSTNEGLISTKFLMNDFMTDWKDSLRRYIQEYYYV